MSCAVSRHIMIENHYQALRLCNNEVQSKLSEQQITQKFLWQTGGGQKVDR
jgi:hypothetical protein